MEEGSKTEEEQRVAVAVLQNVLAGVFSAATDDTDSTDAGTTTNIMNVPVMLVGESNGDKYDKPVKPFPETDGDPLDNRKKARFGEKMPTAISTSVPTHSYSQMAIGFINGEHAEGSQNEQLTAAVMDPTTIFSTVTIGTDKSSGLRKKKNTSGGSGGETDNSGTTDHQNRLDYGISSLTNRIYMGNHETIHMEPSILAVNKQRRMGNAKQLSTLSSSDMLIPSSTYLGGSADASVGEVEVMIHGNLTCSGSLSNGDDIGFSYIMSLVRDVGSLFSLGAAGVAADGAENAFKGLSQVSRHLSKMFDLPGGDVNIGHMGFVTKENRHLVEPNSTMAVSPLDINLVRKLVLNLQESVFQVRDAVAPIHTALSCPKIQPHVRRALEFLLELLSLCGSGGIPNPEAYIRLLLKWLNARFDLVDEGTLSKRDIFEAGRVVFLLHTIHEMCGYITDTSTGTYGYRWTSKIGMPGETIEFELEEVMGGLRKSIEITAEKDLDLTMAVVFKINQVLTADDGVDVDPKLELEFWDDVKLEMSKLAVEEGNETVDIQMVDIIVVLGDSLADMMFMALKKPELDMDIILGGIKGVILDIQSDTSGSLLSAEGLANEANEFAQAILKGITRPNKIMDILMKNMIEKFCGPIMTVIQYKKTMEDMMAFVVSSAGGGAGELNNLNIIKETAYMHLVGSKDKLDTADMLKLIQEKVIMPKMQQMFDIPKIGLGVAMAATKSSIKAIIDIASDLLDPSLLIDLSFELLAQVITFGISLFSSGDFEEMGKSVRKILTDINKLWATVFGAFSTQVKLRGNSKPRPLGEFKLFYLNNEKLTMKTITESKIESALKENDDVYLLTSYSDKTVRILEELLPTQFTIINDMFDFINDMVEGITDGFSEIAALFKTKKPRAELVKYTLSHDVTDFAEGGNESLKGIHSFIPLPSGGYKYFTVDEVDVPLWVVGEKSLKSGVSVLITKVERNYPGPVTWDLPPRRGVTYLFDRVVKKVETTYLSTTSSSGELVDLPCDTTWVRLTDVQLDPTIAPYIRAYWYNNCISCHREQLGLHSNAAEGYTGKSVPLQGRRYLCYNAMLPDGSAELRWRRDLSEEKVVQDLSTLGNLTYQEYMNVDLDNIGTLEASTKLLHMKDVHGQSPNTTEDTHYRLISVVGDTADNLFITAERQIETVFGIDELDFIRSNGEVMSLREFIKTKYADKKKSQYTKISANPKYAVDLTTFLSNELKKDEGSRIARWGWGIPHAKLVELVGSQSEKPMPVIFPYASNNYFIDYKYDIDTNPPEGFQQVDSSSFHAAWKKASLVPRHESWSNREDYSDGDTFKYLPNLVVKRIGEITIIGPKKYLTNRLLRLYLNKSVTKSGTGSGFNGKLIDKTIASNLRVHPETEIYEIMGIDLGPNAFGPGTSFNNDTPAFVRVRQQIKQTIKAPASEFKFLETGIPFTKKFASILLKDPSDWGLGTHPVLTYMTKNFSKNELINRDLHYRGGASVTGFLPRPTSSSIPVHYLNPGNTGDEHTSVNKSVVIYAKFKKLTPTKDSFIMLIEGVAKILVKIGRDILSGILSLVSDDRLKFNEKYITGAIDTIRKLRPQTYNICSFKDQAAGVVPASKPRESGVIIQQLWYDAPELRHLVVFPDGFDISSLPEHILLPDDPSVDPDYTGWPDEAVKLRYMDFIAYLIGGVNELATEKDTMQEAIRRLEAKDAEKDRIIKSMQAQLLEIKELVS